MSELVTVGNITVEVRRNTIRARMYATALYTLSLILIDEIVEEMSISRIALDAALADFALIAPRVKVTEGELDFEFPAHNETPEEFKVKFYDYLDSDFAALIDQIVIAINKLDRAQNDNLLPGVTPKDGEKKR